MAAMSYQVLARKLRPADFSGLVGQDHIVRALRHGLDAGRLHHAYLFTGTRGVGKTTIARILAKCLNCEAGVSSTPCGQCSVCSEVQENRFVDLIEVDAASRTGVDDTRELLETAQYLPARGRYKVYLIDEVHMLSASSFNALLKTLEEPPEHIKFLLATTDPKKVPITVLSRCLQFQLKSISRERIAEYLAGAMGEEGIAFEPEALDLIAKCAQGSMRDALSITDQAIAFGQGELNLKDVADLLGVIGRDEVAAVVAAVECGRPQAVIDISAALAERGADFEAALADLLQALHDIAVAGALEPDGGTERRSLTAEAVQLYYQIALMGYRDMRIGPDPKTVFEMTLLRMLAFAPDAAGAAVPLAKPQRDQAEPQRDQAEPATDEQAHKATVGRQDDSGASSEARGVQDPHSPGQAPHDESVETLASEWRDLVERLDLSGRGKALVEQSILVEKRSGLYCLRLDQAHHALLTDESNAAIEQALASALGRSVRVQFEIGELPAESLASRRERERDERGKAALRQFSELRLTRSLIEKFDGEVVEARFLEAPGF